MCDIDLMSNTILSSAILTANPECGTIDRNWLVDSTIHAVDKTTFVKIQN